MHQILAAEYTGVRRWSLGQEPVVSLVLRCTKSMEHFDANLDNLRLHVAAARRGETVVVLHGFPEFWYSWRSQLPALADAGYRALAPDLRGYNHSERPNGVHHYRIETLVADIGQFIERHAGGKDRFHGPRGIQLCPRHLIGADKRLLACKLLH